MTSTSGVKFEKDSTGVKRYVRIDLKMHGKEIEPFLQKLNKSNNSSFENEWSNSLSPEQFKKKMHSRIKEWKEK
ncbi:MAG: hypothetical protein PF692_11065 [Kiritimatiellae bacterium]|jgi:hypothetical protein|nr:hypothetical protein [Kiritimatiellia bacterium]